MNYISYFNSLASQYFNFNSNEENENRIAYPDYADYEVVTKHLFDLSRTSPSSNFEPFKVNNHEYYACGPAFAIFESIIKEYNEFYEHVENASFQGQKGIIVNLISPTDRYGETIINALYSKQTPSIKHHFNRWIDGKEPDATEILTFAKNIINSLNKNEKIFIHCRMGWQRTATFITLLEILRHPEILNYDNEKVKNFIYETLLQIVGSAHERAPTKSQVEFLFSDDFINIARNLPYQDYINIQEKLGLCARSRLMKQPKEPSFTQSIEINHHSYYSIEPCYALADQNIEFCNFYQKIQKSGFDFDEDIIINLMSQDDKNSEILEEISQSELMDKVLHFNLWKETDAPDMELLKFGKYVKDLLLENPNRKIFIHSKKHSDRSVVFIIILELLRNIELLTKDNKAFILNTLEQLAQSGNDRIPSENQIEFLFSNELTEMLNSLTDIDDFFIKV